MTILPGHIPRLETYAAKAISAVQRLPEDEKVKLLEIIGSLKSALMDQSAFNKRVNDALLDVTETVDATGDASWRHHFLTMGG